MNDFEEIKFRGVFLIGFIAGLLAGLILSAVS